MTKASILARYNLNSLIATVLNCYCRQSGHLMIEGRGFESTEWLPWDTPEQGTYTLLPGHWIVGCPLLHWLKGLNAEDKFPYGN